MTYQIDTGYAVFGVIVHNGKVTHAAPIARWMVGEPWAKVRRWKRIKAIRVGDV